MAISLIWSGVGYAALSYLGSVAAFDVLAALTGLGLGLLDVAANAGGAAVETQQRRSLLPRLHALFSFAAAVGALASFLLPPAGTSSSPSLSRAFSASRQASTSC